MKIYFARYERYFGPFFSTMDKAVEWLKEDDHRPTVNGVVVDDIDEILEGRNAYISIRAVELDDWDVICDG